MIAVNLGGEGEPVPGADVVINVNLFRPHLMVRPRFATRLTGGHFAVAASAGKLPLPGASVDMVVARRFPIQFDSTVDDFTIGDVAREAFRVGRSGASLDLACSSCDLDSLTAAVSDAGFVDVRTDRHKYAVQGRKP